MIGFGPVSDRDGVRLSLRSLLEEYLGPAVWANVQDDTDLFDPAGADLDSLDRVDLMMLFEEQFGVHLRDDVIPSLRTIDQIATHIAELRAFAMARQRAEAGATNG